MWEPASGRRFFSGELDPASMLRERHYILRQASVALDLALTVAGVVFAHALRQAAAVALPQWVRPGEFNQYFWLLAAAPILTVAALGFFGAYRTIGAQTRESIRRIALACMAATALLATVDFFFGPALRPAGTIRTSGAAVLILAPVDFALLTIKTWLLRKWLLARRRAGKDLRSVVLVGSGAALDEIVRAIEAHPLWGMEIAGIVVDRPDAQGGAFETAEFPEAKYGKPLLADLSRAPEALWKLPVDDVILAPGDAPLASLTPLLESCEEMGVRTHLTLNFFKGAIARPVVDRLEDIPVLSYWPTLPIGPALVFKYAFDRIAGLLMLIVFAIPMAAVALAIRRTSAPGEPVFFGQRRCGLNGRLFTMWKFRTMRGDAEAQREALAKNNELEGPAFKMASDPRITPLGRWLRKFSIDELPQLLNVVRGEMSLVGPRPPLPAEVEQYDRWQRRRLSMKPGITCLWQVSGRNRLSFDAWMKMDLEYIDRWSLFLDFKILCRTVYAVVTGDGAM